MRTYRFFENLSEKDHQVIVIQWRDNPINQKLYPGIELLFHIPNETQSARERGQKKLMGMLNGVPDLCLPIARHGKHGLYIEMKKPKTAKSPAGRQSVEQVYWQRRLEENGYQYTVCHGWEEAVDTLIAYLGSGSDG